MNERAVDRSASPQQDLDGQGDGTVWRRIVDRLVQEGEPFANAVRIADQIVRRRRRVETPSTGGPIPDAGSSDE